MEVDSVFLAFLFKKHIYKKNKILSRRWTDLEKLTIWIVINFVTA